MINLRAMISKISRDLLEFSFKRIEDTSNWMRAELENTATEINQVTIQGADSILNNLVRLEKKFEILKALGRPQNTM